MNEGAVIIAVWIKVMKKPFNPYWLSSRKPRLSRWRKLIRHALTYELGWTAYRIAKAEVQALGNGQPPENRKSNIRHHLEQTSQNDLASAEYRLIRQTLQNKEATLMDSATLLLEERTLTLAVALAYLVQSNMISEDQYNEALIAGRQTCIAQITGQ